MCQSIVIPTIILQHAEEAAFLWLLRDAAVRAPHYDLKDLAKLENRIEAHLDGLRIADLPGWDVVKEELKWEDPGAVFTAAFLAYEMDEPPQEADLAILNDRRAQALDAAEKDPETARGFISALGFLPYDKIQSHIPDLLSSEVPLRRRIAIAVLAAHRQDPGKALNELVMDKDPLVRGRALKLVGELGRRDLLSLLQFAVKDEDDDCRFWAGWSATLAAASFGPPVLQAFVLSNHKKYGERAADLLARRLPLPDALAWHKKLADNPDLLRLAAKTATAIADPALMPWIIELMSNEGHARVAGEAFSMITGVDIAYDDLEKDAPPGFEPGPNDDPLDEDVSMDDDEDLSWPDPALICDWWAKNGTRFTPGARYTLGQPISNCSLTNALQNGKQRQRAAAALELAVQHPGQPIFNTCAPVVRQRRLLGLNPR